MDGRSSFGGGLNDSRLDYLAEHVPDIDQCESLGASIARSSRYSCWKQVRSIYGDSFGFGSGAVFFDRRRGSTYSLPAIALSAQSFAQKNSRSLQQLLTALQSPATRG
ncbi:hypothetical protein [Thermoleptolyngbya sp. M55_K2018_002]|uniref:hypothetical protein n=1 Tax=Thermoleptolyngbya sp. M55_K2018_002 TaxID=2747808 RepID=UPI0019DF161D|nr:hypothetical protein [Thermoleptolyngbya sp. M55_K2018_002]HIK40404.1 hypothetical protein [Thermoleptolyngbya sp. M55_K2018_002]